MHLVFVEGNERRRLFQLVKEPNGTWVGPTEIKALGPGRYREVALARVSGTEQVRRSEVPFIALTVTTDDERLAFLRLTAVPAVLKLRALVPFFSYLLISSTLCLLLVWLAAISVARRRPLGTRLTGTCAAAVAVLLIIKDGWAWYRWDALVGRWDLAGLVGAVAGSLSTVLLLVNNFRSVLKFLRAVARLFSRAPETSPGAQ